MGLDVLVASLPAFMLVFCRMAGIVIFNPVLARGNLPVRVRVALVIGLTLLLTPGLLRQGQTYPTDSFSLLLGMSMELFVGFACGVVFQFFYYMLFLVGDLVDTAFGLAMAKVMDPGTNLQMSFSSNFFQWLFVMYLFATDSHLLFIRIVASTYDIVGMGLVQFTPEITSFVLEMFLSAASLTMRLALPFIAASLVLEVAMGVLMKLIPQINVFSIHFQLKIILGFALLFLFAVPTATFIENYMNQMFVRLQNVYLLAG